MKKLILVLALLVTGCATTTEDMTNVIVDKRNQKSYVFPEDAILKQCSELPELKGKTFKDLYNHTISISEIYYACSADKDELSNWIKNFKAETEKSK